MKPFILYIPTSQRLKGEAHDWHAAMLEALQTVLRSFAAVHCGADRRLAHALFEQFERMLREDTTESDRLKQLDCLAQAYVQRFAARMEKKTSATSRWSYGGMEGDKIFVELNDEAAFALFQMGPEAQEQLSAEALAWMIKDNVFHNSVFELLFGDLKKLRPRLRAAIRRAKKTLAKSTLSSRGETDPR